MLVAATAAFTMHLNPDAFKVNTGGDSDNYVLSVTWHPVKMTHKTKIMVLVDGTPFASRLRNLSPWGETMTAVKGARVELTAEMYLPSLQELDCMIMRNGESVPHTGFNKINGPGLVRCSA